ncbi:MAG: RNase adapter RapZ [Clostridiales bacterium]|nr:RNase adapter RapZ [Clostridiales bacterium]
MRFIIVTGMSGAGKTTALKVLEDLGYFCVDNLPIPLMDKFAELTLNSSSDIEKVALGIDIRNGKNLEMMESILEGLTMHHIRYEILFLDATSECLIKRFKETRRNHPLSEGGRVEDGIALERQMLYFLRKQANWVVDTSRLLTRELRSQLEDIFSKGKMYNSLYITVLSFGFKYGIPIDSDLVFDVRFLPNPYYIDELKYKTGNEKEVQDYVMAFDASKQFLKKLSDMIQFLIPNYIQEGKNQLVISVGCTGGKHRSVTMANALFEILNKNKKYGLKIEHRDIEKDSKR